LFEVGRGVIRYTVDEIELGEELGFFESLLALGFSFGLEFVELLQISLQVAIDALLVDGQELELNGLGLEGSGIGQGDVDFAALAFLAEGEHVVLYGAGAVETPAIFGYGIGELVLQGRFGLEAVGELATERVVGFAIFGGQDVDLAGESVTEIVPAGVGFAFWGSWACRAQGVAAVGLELLLGDHGYSVPFLVESEAHGKTRLCVSC
jgi:hypothetical protein